MFDFAFCAHDRRAPSPRTQEGDDGTEGQQTTGERGLAAIGQFAVSFLSPYENRFSFFGLGKGLGLWKSRGGLVNHDMVGVDRGIGG